MAHTRDRSRRRARGPASRGVPRGPAGAGTRARPLGGADAPRRDRPALQPGAQVVGQGLGRRVAAARVLLQALQADRLQVARDLRVDPGRGLGTLLLHRSQGVDHAVAAEGRLAGQQRVEHGAQAVDVGRRGDRAAAARGLLGRHVGGRAQDGARLGQLDVLDQALGQAEVGDVRAALRVDQDVRRLEIAVEDPAHVGVGHGLGRLGDEPGGRPRVVPVRRERGRRGWCPRSASC